MRIIKPIVSLFGFLLFSLMALSSVCFGHSKQDEPKSPIKVESLLAESGYKYVEVRKGLWKIPDLTYQGKNLKKLNIFLEPDPSNNSLRIRVQLDFFPMSAGTTEFIEKMKGLTKRFEPTEFLLYGSSLFAVTKLPGDKVDKKMLVERIEKLSGEADQAYPELAKFIEIERKEIGKPGIGTGRGGGMGVGPGSGNNEPKSSETSQTNVAKTVDSKPAILSRVNPGYTEEARRNSVQGTILLRILVDVDGTAKSVRIVRGLPDGLNEKAIEAAKKTRFKPAMKDGKEVAYWIALEMTFALR